MAILSEQSKQAVDRATKVIARMGGPNNCLNNQTSLYRIRFNFVFVF